jgi:hypothetical protein
MLTEIYPRCFVETAQGMVFAVVLCGVEEGRVLADLRYVREAGAWRKLDTAQANRWLKKHVPDYLYHSQGLDCALHGVPVAAIVKVHEPRARLQDLQTVPSPDAIERRLSEAIAVFAEHDVPSTQIGVTGSILIGAQHLGSDIDLLIFGRAFFERARRAVAEKIKRGRFQALDIAAWRSAYQRRACSLSFDEYLAHERRKHNKFLLDGTKVDLSLVLSAEEAGIDNECYSKRGLVRLSARVADASQAFDYPYRYRIEHPEYAEVVSFTNTYAGQALAGEMIEVVGLVEENTRGNRRIVVGTDREAAGQYIKVPGLAKSGIS